MYNEHNWQAAIKLDIPHTVTLLRAAADSLERGDSMVANILARAGLLTISEHALQRRFGVGEHIGYVTSEVRAVADMPGSEERYV